MFCLKKERGEEQFPIWILATVIVLVLIALIFIGKKDDTFSLIKRALKCEDEKAQEITDYLADNNITYVQDVIKYEDYLLIKVTDIMSCKLYLNSDLTIQFIIKSTSEIPESEKEIESDEESLGEDPGIEKWYYHQGDWYPESYE